MSHYCRKPIETTTYTTALPCIRYFYLNPLSIFSIDVDYFSKLLSI